MIGFVVLTIVIPDSVTAIEAEAFYGCTNLNSIDIPDSVTNICKAAFAECTGLTSITLSNSVTYIDGYLFYGCKSLSSIVIEVHNNDKSSGHCFVKVDIYFTAIGMICIPTEEEVIAIMEEARKNPQEYRIVA